MNPIGEVIIIISFAVTILIIIDNLK